MAARCRPVFVGIEHDHRIDNETDPEFLYLLQSALLLSLKESGKLNMIQYRHAEEKLRRQIGSNLGRGGEKL